MLVANAEQLLKMRADVEAKLSPPTRWCQELLADDSLQRFYRATGGNLPNAVKRLVATAHWRQEARPCSIDCPACLSDPASHFLHL